MCLILLNRREPGISLHGTDWLPSPPLRCQVSHRSGKLGLEGASWSSAELRQGPELDFSPCSGFVWQYETSFWSSFLPASKGSSERLLLLGWEGKTAPNLPVFTLYGYLKI